MKIQRLNLIHFGESSQRKREQLGSDLRIRSGYTLVSVVLDTSQRLRSNPHTLQTVKYIWSSLPPNLFHSFIHNKLKLTKNICNTFLSTTTTLFYFDSIFGIGIFYHTSICFYTIYLSCVKIIYMLLCLQFLLHYLISVLSSKLLKNSLHHNSPH